jgi:hypothetical protein
MVEDGGDPQAIVYPTGFDLMRTLFFPVFMVLGIMFK